MHTPVLLREAVDCLVNDPAGCYVDGTFGRGGHAREVLSRLDARGRLLAIDRDPQAIAHGRETLAQDRRLCLEHAAFDELTVLLERHGMAARVNGILLDLGVSSPQLDDAARGFSFLQDGPLDMRMDTTRGVAAADWIAHAPVAEIESVLREFGEERFARRMAAAIVRERALEPITTTARLARIVTEANPAWERDKHPATRAFQAIRIYLNRELEMLHAVLAQAVDALLPGGRLVVISFHSLEDRIVKRFMRDRARLPTWPGDPQRASLRLPCRAVRASDAEVAANPRSRSAVMRVAEKLGLPAEGRAAHA